MDNAIRTLEEWFDQVTRALTPITVSQTRFPDIDVFFTAGRDDEAVALFEELSAQLEPPLSEYYVPHWAIHVALGLEEDVEAVREAYERALDAVEANRFEVLVPTLTADLGRIQEAEGDYASASDSYGSAMDLDPGLDYRWRLGRALRLAGRLDEAEAELEQALDLRPAAPHLQLQMAMCWRQKGMSRVPSSTCVARWWRGRMRMMRSSRGRGPGEVGGVGGVGDGRLYAPVGTVTNPTEVFGIVRVVTASRPPLSPAR